MVSGDCVCDAGRRCSPGAARAPYTRTKKENTGTETPTEQHTGNAPGLEVWHALSAADQQHIATLFGRDGSGRPRFTQQALATLKALCKTRLRTCSGEYQWQLIFNLTEELNKERSYLQGGNAAQRQLAASMHYFHVPDHILWMMKREHHTRQPYEDIRLSNTE